MPIKIHHKIKKGLSNLQTASEFWGVKLVLVVIVFIGGVYSGRYIFPVNTVSAQDAAMSMGTVTIQVSPEMKLYEQVKQILDSQYINAPKVTESTKTFGSIQGLVASYGDPYTVFFPPAQSSAFKTVVSGSFSGVGMEVGIKNNILTVIAPLKDSPSEKAGIKSGDEILKINGTTTQDMSSDVAVNLIRGDKGTPVTLTIFRTGEKAPRDITVIRDTIDVPVVETKTVGDVFVISIYTFSETSAQKFQDALKLFVASKKQKLVIDLRDNPGGYLDAAVLISSFFFPADKVIVTEDFTRTGEKDVHSSKGFYAIPDSVKIVILVNKGSASASEITAGAFQDYGRAKIVGTQSFGKGSVQQYMDLPDGTSLKVTVARWLTPLGFSISEHGITPDILVNYVPGVGKGLDSQLSAAVKILDNWNTYSKYSSENKLQYDYDKKALVPASQMATTTNTVSSTTSFITASSSASGTVQFYSNPVNQSN